MNVDKLAGQLANKHEGLRLFPYLDTVGKLTIGVGHNLTDNGITANQAAMLLYDDIKQVTDLLDRKLPWWKALDEVRQRALANMTFNLMGKILDFHNMLAYLQAKEWDKAAESLLASKFATQVGKRASDLAEMIRTGKDVS